MLMHFKAIYWMHSFFFFPISLLMLLFWCSLFVGNKFECFDMNIIMFDLEFS